MISGTTMVADRVSARPEREELKRSLQTPHCETNEFAEVGFGQWASTLPEEQVSDLVDFRAGRSVRWVPGRGWLHGN